MASDNYIDYPSMVREREEEIQQGNLAKSDDINAELNAIVDTYNRLVALLQGEFGGTGRIYELVENAVTTATQALNKANNAVDKYGDTMIGHLLIELTPASDYDVVNKLYVDDLVNNTTGPIANNVTTLIDRLNNLTANNVKLDNANFVSNNVNDGMNELFQSVSNGKKAIADALTDKGYETSATATFQTMASRIYDILTFTEGTAGGNITPATVLKGYVGYSKGSVIVGTHECDAEELLKQADPLIPDNIAYGKKAFGSNGLIVGTHQDGGQYPTYGTDTSDGTATANDIMEGKIAYSRGVRLVGKLKQVEEVLGYQDDSIEVFQIGGARATEYTYNKFAFSKGVYGHCVALATEKATNEQVILSYEIYNDQLATMETVDVDGVTVEKKYKYTKADLGLNPNRPITNISVGVRGYNGKSNLAVLYVEEGRSTDTSEPDYAYSLVHAYPYHLVDSGVIGNLPGENYYYPVCRIASQSETQYISGNTIHVPANVHTDILAVGTSSWSYVGIHKVDLVNNRFIWISGGNPSTSTRGYSIMDPGTWAMSENDKFLYVCNVPNTWDVGACSMFALNDSCMIRGQATMIDDRGSNTRYFIDDERMILLKGKLLRPISVDASGSISLGENINLSGVALKYIIRNITKITADAYIYDVSYYGASLKYVYYRYLLKLDSTNNGEFIELPTPFSAATTDADGADLMYSSGVPNMNSVMTWIISGNGKLQMNRTSYGTNDNIIGIRYAGSYYVKTQNTLTATPSNVDKDKTFIGSTGVVQTGTRE